MRKVSKEIAVAFTNGKKKTNSNTMTNGSQVFLHGNLIAKKGINKDDLYFTLAGWGTPTTRERLNVLIKQHTTKSPDSFGISQRKGVQCWVKNAEVIDPIYVNGWYKVDRQGNLEHATAEVA